MKKNVFGRRDLGTNVLALNTRHGGNARCFVVSTAEAGQNGTVHNKNNFEKKQIIITVIIFKTRNACCAKARIIL